MSLKAFHILFIIFSILLAFGFGVWEIAGFSKSDDISQLVVGIISFLIGIGLVVYGIRFLRKLKNVSML